MDVTAIEAQQQRRKALWNARCRCSGPLDHCLCVSTCEKCGHIRVDHDYDFCADMGGSFGGCEVPDCTCGRFQRDDDE